jgi:hypothetical protein
MPGATRGWHGFAHEAFMKAIDKNRFRQFLLPDEQALANSAGAAPEDVKRAPGDFVKRMRGARD